MKNFQAKIKIEANLQNKVERAVLLGRIKLAMQGILDVGVDRGNRGVKVRLAVVPGYLSKFKKTKNNEDPKKTN